MRLEITQRADLAVRALVLLAESGDRLKSVELADALDATPGVVPQALGPLVRLGWVRSVPGPTGGYESVKPLNELNVLQVIELIDGPTDNGRCVVAGRDCDAGDRCALHESWAQARGELLDSLGGTSLASIGGPC
ncbi:MAG: Rrf2 family transcriptional regulator [Ilumatobacteraceae bacterium]|nr:Rrf2 family transcriptional regulator [Ilumatobacteraceae bacterium]